MRRRCSHSDRGARVPRIVKHREDSDMFRGEEISFLQHSKMQEKRNGEEQLFTQSSSSETSSGCYCCSSDACCVPSRKSRRHNLRLHKDGVGNGGAEPVDLQGKAAAGSWRRAAKALTCREPVRGSVAALPSPQARPIYAADSARYSSCEYECRLQQPQWRQQRRIVSRFSEIERL